MADLGALSAWVIPAITSVGTLLISGITIWVNALNAQQQIKNNKEDLERKLAADVHSAELRFGNENAALEARLRATYRLEYAAENVALELMKDPRYEMRSFSIIAHHLGGFEPNELRKILVRVGAVRFFDTEKIEYWGLLQRNWGNLGRKPDFEFTNAIGGTQLGQTNPPTTASATPPQPSKPDIGPPVIVHPDETRPVLAPQ